MGYLPIKNQIVSILNGITSVKVVYGKEAKLLNQYPAVCVSAKENTGEFHTVGSGGANNNKYRHFVRLYFPTDEQDDADYEDVLEGVADEVIAALAHNITLNGSCDYSIPISGEWRDGMKEVAVRYLEIIVESTIHATR